ncbi:MAG: phosphatase [Clostridia bacterium]|nr:phosphatase [Clostridia bacterium]
MSNTKKSKFDNRIFKHIRMYYGELIVFSVFVVIASLMIWHYFGYGSWALDKSLHDFMGGIRSSLLDTLFRAITYTGETIPVIIMVLIVIFLFIYQKKRKEAALVAGYMLGVWLLNELLKRLIGRPRPDISLHLVEATGWSLPSGHSMNFMAFTLIALYFIWLYSRSKRLNIAATIIMLSYALLMGLSRVYLNVHYFSDVLTGWSIGASCAAIAVIIHRVWTENKM